MKWTFPSLNLGMYINPNRIASQTFKKEWQNCVDPNKTAHYELSSRSTLFQRYLIWSAGWKGLIFDLYNAESSYVVQKASSDLVFTVCHCLFQQCVPSGMSTQRCLLLIFNTICQQSSKYLQDVVSVSPRRHVS